jgi:hypothetical protein
MLIICGFGINAADRRVDGRSKNVAVCTRQSQMVASGARSVAYLQLHEHLPARRRGYRYGQFAG